MRSVTDPRCTACGDDYSAKRLALGYKTCTACGDNDAREQRLGWAIVPLPKQGYTRVTRKEDLLHLNQKPR